MARVEVETPEGGGEVVNWPNCATPDCPNLCYLWSETPLCYPCAVHQLGQSEMDRLYEVSHGEA